MYLELSKLLNKAFIVFLLQPKNSLRTSNKRGRAVVVEVRGWRKAILVRKRRAIAASDGLAFTTVNGADCGVFRHFSDTSV